MFKKVYTYIAAAFVALIGLLIWEKKEKDNAEASLNTANADKIDSTLAQKQSDDAAQITQVQQQTQTQEQKVANESLSQLANDLNSSK